MPRGCMPSPVILGKVWKFARPCRPMRATRQPTKQGLQPTPTTAATTENRAPEVRRVRSAVGSHAHARQPGAAAPAKATARRRTPATLLGPRSVSAQSASEFVARGRSPTRVARGLENTPRATGELQPWSSSPLPSWQPAAARREGYLAKRAALAAGEWLSAPAAPPVAAPPVVWEP